MRIQTLLLIALLLAGLPSTGCTILVLFRGTGGTPTGQGAPPPGGAANPSGTQPPTPPGPPPPTGSNGGAPGPDPGASLPPPNANTPSPSAPAPGSGGSVVPPFSAASGGKGGTANVRGVRQQANGVSYNLIVPASYSGNPTPLLMVYSGTEGADQMTQNLLNLGPGTGLAEFIIAVLDGVQYYGNGQAGTAALDDVRARYNVDNDRTCLLGESAGTSAAEQLGFHLRQSYFAAYWANDINTVDGPAQTAAQLGFAPSGQVGPGGEIANAQAIADAMRQAGYRLPDPAPYAGTGANQHGNPQQLIEALRFFPGKTRR